MLLFEFDFSFPVFFFFGLLFVTESHERELNVCLFLLKKERIHFSLVRGGGGGCVILNTLVIRYTKYTLI